MNLYFYLASIIVFSSISGKNENDFSKEKAFDPAPLPVTYPWPQSDWTSQLTPVPAPQPAPQATPQSTPVPVPQPPSVSPPVPVPQPAPVPGPVPLPQPMSQCPIPECSFPSVCIQAEIYATCIAPTSSTSPNNTCSLPGPCLTTLTATDTTTLTRTQTERKTVATLTNTETTTKTNTALTTQTHTQTDVITATSTLTTTNTEVATSTHHTTKTSTAVLTSHVPVTSTTTLTTTSVGLVNTTNTHTVTSTAVVKATETSTAIVTDTLTSTYNATNVITATATSTATLTATSTAKTTETMTATSTAVLTQTLTNTHNQTITQTKTLTATSTSVVTTCSANCTKIVVTPTTPTPPTQPPKCDQALDIAVIIDGSESVKKPNFNTCLQFVANLSNRFNVSEQGSHFGCIVYSTEVYPQFSFKDFQYYNAESLKRKILSLIEIYPRQGTRTDLALIAAYNELFSYEGGDRVDKPNVLIVITDGLTDPRSTPYPTVLQPFKEKNIEVIAIGVGNEINRKELNEIAMNETNHVIMVNQYEDLVTILDDLLKQSCSQVTIPTPPPTQPPKPPPPTAPPHCDEALDIVVIIDGSESVKEPNFKMCLQFVANLSNHFKVSEQGTHFGGIVYSTKVYPQLSLKDTQYYSRESLARKIESFPFIRQGTRTDLALEAANKLFSEQEGDRVDKPNVLIVITDGLTDPDRSKPYPTVLQPLKAKKVQVIAIGVGNEVNSAELTAIAMNDKKRVFMVNQYKDLFTILDELLDKSCQQGPSSVKLQGDVYENCPVDYIKKGCFNDLQSPRPLPRLMFTDLDKATSTFSGVPVDWGRWNGYLDDVVCRCAQVSKAKGFNYFGIENFGECWSGESADKTYNKDGSSEFCITKDFAQCDTKDKNLCCGNKTTAFIYSIQETYESQQGEGCFTQFKNVGCFADRQIPPRPIPELIFTDMNNGSLKYSGREAQLGELDTYLGDVLCRCAEQAKELGYQYFGVQNHGECYSGPNIGQTYSKDGSSKDCITRDFQTCPAIKPGKDAQEDCVGVQGSNYVYRVTG